MVVLKEANASHETEKEPAMTTKKDAALNAIATRVLNLETLETRRSDSLDFSDQAVWVLKDALEMAYEAGRKSAGKKVSNEIERFLSLSSTK
jgi:hypothetical protein